MKNLTGPLSEVGEETEEEEDEVESIFERKEDDEQGLVPITEIWLNARIESLDEFCELPKSASEKE